MAEIPYRLVDSVVRVRGTMKATSGPYETSPKSVEDIHVEILHRGETGQGYERRLRTGDGNQEFNVEVTADGRLQSVQYKRVGAGPAVLTAGVKLVGFVASTAFALVSAARGGVVASEGEGKPEQEPPDPRADWAAVHEEAAALLESNKKLAKDAAARLLEIRTSLVAAPDVRTARGLIALERTTAAVVNAARAEVARLEALYGVWLASQRTVSTAALECLLDIEQLPDRPANRPASEAPALPEEDARTYRLWSDFELVLEVVDPRLATGAVGTHMPPMGDAEQERRLVRWRVPRTVELWVWKKGSEEDLVLVTRTPIRIGDERCDTHAMELRAGAFGDHGGAWTFNDDGLPASIRTTDKGTAGALAEALSAAPDTLVGAVEQAKKLTDTLGGIQDAAAERRKAAAERELATAKARIELLGVNATAEDVAELARAEQAVKLRAATRSISSEADELDDLKQRLDQLTTQNAIVAQQRTAAVEADLQELKAEVSRLEQEVLVAKANFDIDNPDKIKPPG